MCGIAGYILKNSQKHSRQSQHLLRSIRQRGPDDEGICLVSRDNNRFQSYITERTVESLQGYYPPIYGSMATMEHDVALLNTRYAIIDLTDRAHQPFSSQDESIQLVFNGEIYNYRELKEELKAEGVKFWTTSDTEVLVEGYRFWRDGLWSKLNGFWAIALYDRTQDILLFSRDRMGVAPLYYLETTEGVYFASCIDSLLDVSLENVSIDNDVVLGFAQTGIKDHDRKTFYKQIHSFPTGANVIFPYSAKSMKTAFIRPYWQLPSTRLKSSEISFDQAVKTFRDLFFNAVNLRLRADVKVAFELSGGLDSSSVVAAAATFKSNLRTYTAKINESADEGYAKFMMDRYALDYRLFSDPEGEFIHGFGRFANVMEEPYDNPNDFSHYQMLQKMKDDGIDVVVTGAGGDEVFAGYESSYWPRAYSELKKMGKKPFLIAEWYEFCRRFRTPASSMKTLHHYISDTMKYLTKQTVGRKKPRTNLRPTSASNYQSEYYKLSFHEQCRFHFTTALLPYYMRSSDHFTMTVPIEHRFPLLDYRIVEFGLSLPIQYLFQNGWTKYVLRKAMEPYLPKQIVWRREKAGFNFPYRTYFTEHQKTFEPLLKELRDINFPLDDFDDYETLLEYDPVLLWRLLSIAIWVRYTVKMNSKIRS